MLAYGQGAALALWDIRGAKPKAAMFGHESPITEIAYSPDGTTLATGSKDNTVRIWNSHRQSEPETISTRTANDDGLPRLVNGPQFAPCGDTFFCSDEDHIVQFATASGKEIARWRAFEPTPLFDRPPRAGMEIPTIARDVFDMTISRNGRMLATLSTDTVNVWSLPNRELLTSFAVSTSFYRLLFSPDDRFLFVGSGTWDTASWQESSAAAPEGFNDLVFAASSHGNRYVSATAKETFDVTLRNAADAAVVLERKLPLPGMRECALSPDGDVLAIGSYTGNLEIWREGTSWESTAIQAHSNIIQNLAFSPDGRTLVTTSMDGTAKLWDPVTGQERLALRRENYAPVDAAFAPDGRSLIIQWHQPGALLKRHPPLLCIYRLSNGGL